MAHLKFEQIRDGLVGDAQLVNSLVESIQKCETAQDARYLAEHLASAADTILDMTNMVDDIVHGRKDEYDDADDDGNDTPGESATPLYPPSWSLIKNCEDGSILDVRLHETDMYEGRCPHCDCTVLLEPHVFFSIVADENCEGLETSVVCDECAKKRKKSAN